MFEVVFDYWEHYFEDNQNHQPTFVFIDDLHHKWKKRQDPFSSYCAGFEVRTYRCCQRILMFHHFSRPEELSVQDYLVRSTEFAYDDVLLLLHSIANYLMTFLYLAHDGLLCRPIDRKTAVGLCLTLRKPYAGHLFQLYYTCIDQGILSGIV